MIVIARNFMTWQSQFLTPFEKGGKGDFYFPFVKKEM